MVTAVILNIVRQKIGQAIAEINGDSPEYTDSFLLSYVETTSYDLNALGIITGVTVDSGVGTVTPEPSDIIGLTLAYGAAASIISDDMIKKLRGGELGLSFSSGATQITTNQAAINLKGSADKLSSRYDLMITAYLSGDPNSVLSRIQ